MTRRHYDALRTGTGALLIGDAENVAERIVAVNEALGGISRLTFQMSAATLTHAELMGATELLGSELAPRVRRALGEGFQPGTKVHSSAG